MITRIVGSRAYYHGAFYTLIDLGYLKMQAIAVDIQTIPMCVVAEVKAENWSRKTYLINFTLLFKDLLFE